MAQENYTPILCDWLLLPSGSHELIQASGVYMGQQTKQSLVQTIACL